jgi:hypothetical protein
MEEENNNNNNNNSNTTDVVLNDASQHHQEEQQEQPPETATNIARAYIPSIAPSVPKGTATILLVFITWVMLYCVLGDIL